MCQAPLLIGASTLVLRLKALTLDTDVVVEALRSVDNDPLVEVSSVVLLWLFLRKNSRRPLLPDKTFLFHLLLSEP